MAEDNSTENPYKKVDDFKVGDIVNALLYCDQFEGPLWGFCVVVKKISNYGRYTYTVKGLKNNTIYNDMRPENLEMAYIKTPKFAIGEVVLRDGKFPVTIVDVKPSYDDVTYDFKTEDDTISRNYRDHLFTKAPPTVTAAVVSPPSSETIETLTAYEELLLQELARVGKKINLLTKLSVL
jgi:hypothetical protein